MQNKLLEPSKEEAKKPTASGRVRSIGIDLGTTHACIGLYRNGNVEIIANEHGNRTTPTCVAFADTNLLVGEDAVSQAATNPLNTISSTKHIIGCRFRIDDPKKKPLAMKFLPFEYDESGKPLLRVAYKGRNQCFAPEDISSLILRKLKLKTELYLGQKVSRAVISVPSTFDLGQRLATRAAAAMAGFKKCQVMTEATAAALIYGVCNCQDGEKKRIVVFSLGGGFCDVSVVIVEDSRYEVRGTGGKKIGGDNFDLRMLNFFLEECKVKYNEDIGYDKRAVIRLKAACERAKRTLSSLTEASVEIAILHDNVDFKSKITCNQFEEICQDLFSQIVEPIENALHEAKCTKTEIDEVVLVGGSTRIPKIQQILQDFFDGKKMNLSINSGDEAVAFGAAVQAATLANKMHDAITSNDIVTLVTPVDYRIKTAGGVLTSIVRHEYTDE